MMFDCFVITNIEVHNVFKGFSQTGTARAAPDRCSAQRTGGCKTLSNKNFDRDLANIFDLGGRGGFGGREARL